mmetsp:Transcript_70470/g.198900  ORF Transcript_70470/g.198900 Transcript_70470/m.198900 type:complete len:311 (+) Transcript_70470:339-1271(+)
MLESGPPSRSGGWNCVSLGVMFALGSPSCGRNCVSLGVMSGFGPSSCGTNCVSLGVTSGCGSSPCAGAAGTNSDSLGVYLAESPPSMSEAFVSSSLLPPWALPSPSGLQCSRSPAASAGASSCGRLSSSPAAGALPPPPGISCAWRPSSCGRLTSSPKACSLLTLLCPGSRPGPCPCSAWRPCSSSSALLRTSAPASCWPPPAPGPASSPVPFSACRPLGSAAPGEASSRGSCGASCVAASSAAGPGAAAGILTFRRACAPPAPSPASGSSPSKPRGWNRAYASRAVPRKSSLLPTSLSQRLNSSVSPAS